MQLFICLREFILIEFLSQKKIPILIAAYSTNYLTKMGGIFEDILELRESQSIALKKADPNIMPFV